jgi:DNA invertase Pin-like site-specific DNA recombinase
MATKTKPTTKRTAAIYVRVSQDRTGEAAGVKRQEADCRKLCTERGYEVGDVYRDNDLSAFAGKHRPEWERLQHDLKSGQYVALVAWHPDRLTRSVRELEDLVDIVDAAGVQVATVRAGTYDLSTPAGRVTARLIGATARYESELKSDRLRRQRAQAAQEGRCHGGGTRAYGYTADGVTVEKGEAREIKRAAARVIAGDPVRSIARNMNERGLRTSTGREWSTTTLRRMLMSLRIAGRRDHNGADMGPAEWPAILDDETHRRVVEILSRPERRTPGRPGGYLLSGIVRCNECGGRMHIGYAHRDRQYRCAKTPAVEGSCGGVSIAAEPLEEIITEAVLHRIDNAAVRRAMSRRPRRNGGGANAAAVLADCEQRLVALAEMFAAGELSRREWQTAREKLDGRRAEAMTQLAREDLTNPVRPIADAGDPRDAWERATVEQRRAVIGALAERVTIAPTDANWFDPDRIDIAWRV